MRWRTRHPRHRRRTVTSRDPVAAAIAEAAAGGPLTRRHPEAPAELEELPDWIEVEASSDVDGFDTVVWFDDEINSYCDPPRRRAFVPGVGTSGDGAPAYGRVWVMSGTHVPGLGRDVPASPERTAPVHCRRSPSTGSHPSRTRCVGSWSPRCCRFWMRPGTAPGSLPRG